VFFKRWMARLPLTQANRATGYWFELSMRQIEISRTIVFTQRRYARAFTDAPIVDNLDLGHPDTLEIVSDRQVRKNTEGEFKPRSSPAGSR
jgi:hypothetical protein